MTFLGYQILNGEMVEGFRICEQEICRYVAGYAQFYEKMTACWRICWRTGERKRNRRN